MSELKIVTERLVLGPLLSHDAPRLSPARPRRRRSSSRARGPTLSRPPMSGTNWRSACKPRTSWSEMSASTSQGMLLSRPSSASRWLPNSKDRDWPGKPFSGCSTTCSRPGPGIASSPRSILGTGPRWRFWSAWGCGARRTSTRACGSRANGPMTWSTPSSTGSGESAHRRAPRPRPPAGRPAPTTRRRWPASQPRRTGRAEERERPDR